MKRGVKLGLGLVVAVLLISVFGHAFFGRTTGNTQTSTAAAYAIEIQPLNSSVSAVAGSSVDLMFNVTSPQVGPLYFYATDVPAPGSHTTLNLQNVTAGNIELPPGVQVSYPTGQAVFGTSHAVLTLRVALSPTVNGTVWLEVGAFQQASPDQVIGYGSGFHITVNQA
jgi:hypothetical protein